MYLFTCVLISTLSLSQNTIFGKVIEENNNALAYVEIKNQKASKTFFTDVNGNFKINEEGIYMFTKAGYKTTSIQLFFGKSYNIKLLLNPSQLNEVIVTSSLIPQTLKTLPTTTHIILRKDINLNNNTNINTTLNTIPGVFMQSGALNTNRITIRGIGARNLFGTSKIRAYFKDIPLTNGSGETNIEDFELGAISRIEIRKGATSSTYGAGLGGTITLFPETSNFNKKTINNQLTIGSFGLIKNLTSLNYHTKKQSLNVVYSNTHSNGFRDNNTYNRQAFLLHTNHSINNKNHVSFLGSYVNLKAFIPSSLNETNYENTPKMADFNWNNAKGFEDSKRGIFGVSWEHNYNNKLKQNTSIFSSFRSAFEPRPFNILKENTFAYGARTRLTNNLKLFKKPLSWTLGGEYFKDIYTYKTFENLYEDFPPETGSVQGNLLANFEENRSYFNIFFEVNYKPTTNTTIIIGSNLNKTSYTLYDNFTASAENPDQSGKFKYKTIISPKFGISHQATKNFNIYSNISHGFSPLSLNETLLPNGLINTDLNPETGWNFETGIRATSTNNKLQLNIAIYRLSLKNLLVAQRTSEDQFIGINAGKTQHNGLETSINYHIISNKKINLRSSINASLTNYKFKHFIDNTNNYSGNKVTGVPLNTINANTSFNIPYGIYGNINFLHVGKIPITDANNLFSKPYNLTNTKIGFKKKLNKNIKTNLFIGINNIFDVKYASQILINASSFGGNAPRYYYPGNPVNFYSGFNLNYTF
ncbi:TonB-dependent receptor [Seonamhaeicola algicola]|uniref:TonB-dependent receptor n=1 Tax=Seonamhaeicola algicola TaxID=1719036 RepID=A0A5C7AR53_9FLAO|nr:TonB-dependent receptor [Seonamhaeicola algicola]